MVGPIYISARDSRSFIQRPSYDPTPTGSGLNGVQAGLETGSPSFLCEISPASKRHRTRTVHVFCKSISMRLCIIGVSFLRTACGLLKLKKKDFWMADFVYIET